MLKSIHEDGDLEKNKEKEREVFRQKDDLITQISKQVQVECSQLPSLDTNGYGNMFNKNKSSTCFKQSKMQYIKEISFLKSENQRLNKELKLIQNRRVKRYSQKRKGSLSQIVRRRRESSCTYTNGDKEQYDEENQSKNQFDNYFNWTKENSPNNPVDDLDMDKEDYIYFNIMEEVNDEDEEEYGQF